MSPRRPKIRFDSNGIAFQLPSQRSLRDWICKIIEQQQKPVDWLQYIFTSDEILHGINKTYLHHDNYTDIITFPYQQEPIQGEMYISIERIADNAASLSVPFHLELCRVMIHGFLHLCGQEDKTPEGRRNMRALEDACLSELHIRPFHPPV